MSSTALQTVNTHLPIGSIEAYIQRVNTIPLLSEEEEYELGERLQKYGDLKAAQKLVTSHLRYVVRVAKGYVGYGLHLADLIQEGTIGLMKAVKRFQPNKGVRLVTFAVHWIKAEMHEFIIRNWRIVKVATTKAQRKLFFNLRSAKKYLGWFTQEEIESVAKDLGVKADEVVRMEQRLHAGDVSFDLPQIDEHSDRVALPAPSGYLESKEVDPSLQMENKNWADYTHDKLQHALISLDARSRDILEKRWIADNKSTLSELAAYYKVSVERIRQLEQNAIHKLRVALEVE